MLRFQHTRVILHHREINELLNSPIGPVYRLVNRTGRSVLTSVRRETPVDTSAMLRLNYMRMFVRPYYSVIAQIFNTDEAAMWVQQGTGIYRRPLGPPLTQGRFRRIPGEGTDRQRPVRKAAKKVAKKGVAKAARRRQARGGAPGRVIRPRRARALVFPDRRAGRGVLFRAWVRGQTPNRFMFRGLIRGLAGRQRWTVRTR